MKIVIKRNEFDNIKKFFVVHDPADIVVKKSGKLKVYPAYIGYIPLWRCSDIKKQTKYFPLKTFKQDTIIDSKKCFKYDPDNRVILSGYVDSQLMDELIEYKNGRMEKDVDLVIGALMHEIGIITDTTKIPVVEYRGFSINTNQYGILISTMNDVFTFMTNESSFHFEKKQITWEKDVISFIGYIDLDDLEKLVKSKLLERRLKELMDISEK